MESFEELSRHFGITGTVQETMCDEFYRQGYLAGQAALAASPVPAGWLPIDSAPKLKKIVVAYRNSAGKWRRVLATYWPAETLESDHSNSGWADEGWYEATEAYEELAPLEGDPVCWSELPPINDASAPAPTTPNGLTESETLATASVAGLSAPAQQAACSACNGTGEAVTCCGNPVAGAEYMGSTEWVCCGNPDRDGCSQCAAPAPSVEAQADKIKRVLARLDALGDDAAAHIWPTDLERCMRQECVVKVSSVRMGSPDGKTVPLFSREQVAAALKGQS